MQDKDNYMFEKPIFEQNRKETLSNVIDVYKISDSEHSLWDNLEKYKSEKHYTISDLKCSLWDNLEKKRKDILINNKDAGKKREEEVLNELRQKYPEDKGYKIEREVPLRGKDGEIAKDPVTGEGRRIDFVVIKDGKVIDSIEVTSKTANKEEQMSKDHRIREKGGNYIKDSNGNLIEMPENVQTRIERRD